MDHQAIRPAPSLPRTIEESTRRYLANYSRNFSGPAHELSRLKAMTKAFIYRLRKTAPRFYEEKLPTFINQACSTLLTFDTTKPEGAKKFHICHRSFLLILGAFAQSQPAGEVNFHNERLRLEERNKLIQRQTELEAIIDKLEATEIDYEDIGNDDPEAGYEKLVRELDFYKSEMKRISIELAYIEGLDVEEKPHFDLVVQPRSLLNRLTQEQLSNLEQQMFEVVKANKNKRTAMTVDISLIESMIEKLNIDPSLFKKEELRHITKDALDAYKDYFRTIDAERRDQYYDELCRRKSLLPKEGLILASPDDVPTDVKIKLEQNNAQCKREIEELIEEYSKRPCADDHAGDLLEGSDDDEGDERARIIETVRRKGIKFERVKEEPRDDCEEEFLLSGDEVEVDARIANAIVDDRNIHYAGPSTLRTESDMENEDDLNNKEVKMETNGSANESVPSTNTCDNDDDDDDIECLGTIEPDDKIEKVELVDD